MNNRRRKKIILTFYLYLDIVNSKSFTLVNLAILLYGFEIV